MSDVSYSWLTAHRARLTHERSPGDTVVAAPKGAKAWRYGPSAPLGENGLRTGCADLWGGVAFYDDRADAVAALSGPLPFEDIAEETWHGVLAVIAHRGEVDWSTKDEPHPAPKPLSEDPGGPMVVITSAGFTWMDESRHPALKDFLQRVDRVVEHYRSLEGNLGAQLFNANGTPEGMTFSIWKDDAAMLAAAYREGRHPENLSQHRKSPMFDRSSFTRMRLLKNIGTWDGRDPMAAAQV